MWYYNSIRITVYGHKTSDEQIIAELQPLDSGTVYQPFGHINQITNLQCYVVGDTDKLALKSLIDDGVAYTLSGNGGNYGLYYLKKATFEWLHTYKQTFRTDAPEDAPVYKVALDLLKTT